MAFNFYLPGTEIPAQTARNRTAVLYLLLQAGCPYDVIGAGAAHCTDGRINIPWRVWLPLTLLDADLADELPPAP
jgi:hypothetical protein